MKKTILIIVIAILIIVGGIEIFITLNDNKSTNDVAQDSEETKEIVNDVYYFEDGTVEIKIGEEFNKDELGEEEAYSEIESCAFEGLDKVYTYENYEITTFEDGEIEKVYSIYLLNEEVETTEGVKILDTLDDMISAYGEDYEALGNQYSYTKGNTSLDFIIEDDVITSIQYTYIVE